MYATKIESRCYNCGSTSLEVSELFIDGFLVGEQRKCQGCSENQFSTHGTFEQVVGFDVDGGIHTLPYTFNEVIDRFRMIEDLEQAFDEATRNLHTTFVDFLNGGGTKDQYRQAKQELRDAWAALREATDG